MAVDLTKSVISKFATMLRARQTDPNSTNRVGANWIYIGWPDTDIVKNSFPRIIVSEVTQNSETFDLNENFMNTTRLNIKCEVWIDRNDPMILTISAVTYANEKLLAWLVADVVEKTKDNLGDLRDSDLIVYNPLIQTLGASVQDPDDDRILSRSFDVIFQHV